jgi:tetratricopeptide (TPR) repeat protein
MIPSRFTRIPAIGFRTHRASTAAAFLVLLAACSQPAPPAKQTVRPDRNAVAEIRATGAAFESAVEVHPLRDSAVDGLVAQAKQAEAAGRYDDAVAAVDHALEIAPDAPELLQYLAELEILRGHWQRAEQLAMQSFRLGPKVGGLCARNWQTVIEARIVFDDPATRASAEKNLANCRVAPPVRM